MQTHTERSDALADTDIKRAKQIAAYPWFSGKKQWQKEIETMLTNGFKLEVEALISKDISYVTEVYVPERLEENSGSIDRLLHFCSLRGSGLLTK